mmetsp:Transcript_776/g.1703  ORF Transcript_776/g.1703 Transcript_776/m.1703 type:complete len:497 (-) Transcript_776:85-1575(-)
MAPNIPLATPMPPEPPQLNLSSPRIRAAMRVMGVLEQDIVARPRDHYELEVAYEFFERKRRTLIDQIQTKANDGPEAHTIVAASAFDPNAQFMAEIDAIEKRNIEKMNSMAKKEVTKLVIEELEAKSQSELAKQKQEESAQRQKEFKKARDEKLREAQKVAQKKNEKSADVRARTERQQKEEAEALQQQLEEANAKAEAAIGVIAENHEANRVRKQKRRDLAWERKEMLEKGILDMKHEAYSKILDRDADVAERLANRLAETQQNSAAIAEKINACTFRAQQKLQLKQDDIENKYRERLAHHEEVHKKRTEAANAYLKEQKDKNRKTRQKFENTYKSIIERESHPIEDRRLERAKTLQDFSSQGCFGRHEYTHNLDCHKTMTDLAEFNRQQLRRAHAYHQEQAIEKIANTRDRVKVLLDSRVKAGQRRMAMIKNCASEKHELTFQVDRARSSGPNRMTKFLSTIEPDQESATRINDLLSTLNMELLPGTVKEDEEK